LVGLLRKLSLGIYYHPVLALITVTILAFIGLGAAGIVSYAWAEWHYQAAQRALERRDFGAALQHVSSCLESRAESAEANFLAARLARMTLDYRAAGKHLRNCERFGGLREMIDLERALARAQRGELADVDQRLLGFVERGHPDSLLILEALSRGYLANFRLQEAQHCLEHWLEQRPNDVQALLWRGEIWERLLKVEDALADYRRAIELAPDRNDERLHLAETLIAARQPAEASLHLSVLAERRPEDADILLNVARCRRLQGKADEARGLIDRALSLAPKNASALAERGRLELEHGRPAEAEPWLRRAVALAPYEKAAVYALYQCLQQIGPSDEAEKYRKEFDKIEANLDRLSFVIRKINTTPFDPSLRQEAGMIFLRNGQEKAGLAWLASALQIDPLYPPTHEALAGYFDGSGERGEAAWHRELARLRPIHRVSKGQKWPVVRSQ
jgi:Tfp pilus assembly protein PilF